MTTRRVAAGLVALAMGSIALPLVAAPAFEAAGTAVGGTGAVSPAWPAHAAGDIALLFVETTGGQTAALSTAAGFVEISGSPQATGTTTNGTRITVFWARATTAAMASPTVTDPGDHVYAQILTYRGAAATGIPWNVTGGGVKATASTSVTITGVTTTAADTLIVQAVARDNDSAAAAFSALANANLTSLTEQTDAGTTSGNGGGFVVWDGVKASAGATGNTTATVASSINAFITIALVEDPPSIFSHWRMDQTAGWNGTAGEVLDNGSGAFLGTAAGLTTPPTTSNAAPAIPGDPGSCHYGVFNRSNKDYVALPAGYPNLAAAAGAFTVTAWIKSTNATLPGQRILIDDQNNTTPGGWGFSVGETAASGAGGLRFFYRQAVTFILDTAPVSSGEWLFVALTVSFEAGSNASRAALYAFNTSGTVVATATSAFTWTAGTDAGPSSIGGETNASGEGTNAFGFGGNIDEVRVYRQFLSQARLDLIRQETRPCAVVNHFSISHAGSGIACVDQGITVTAHDASHNAVNANGLLVNLSTTNGKGTWTAILAGGGTLTDTVAGDGAATYQFAPGSNSVQLAFRYANLAATSETFGFNVSGGGFSETTGTASGTDDPSFTMAQAGFQFRNVTDGNATIPVQISGKPSNGGFNSKTLRIQAIRTDTVTGSCAGLFASQMRTVDLGAECNSPATCAARQVSVNATNIATSNNNGGAGASAYTGVSLTFNASSEADAVITYPDAGQISLHARYDLDPLSAGYEMLGSSNTFVVRPFGLAFPGINHGSTAAGSLIGAAGDNFAMAVQAYQWASGEDANSDGVPDAGVNITDNGTVPNFAGTATVGRSANLPGVALGTVSRGAACASAATIALSGGTASAADWCYSEVGNVLLTADVTNYISAGINITGSSALDGVAGGGYVGRFKPKSFVVTGAPALTNRSALACASTFTYLDEDLSFGFTLEARNTQNALTRNYTGAYARLDLTAAANLGIGARSGATNLTSRVDNGVAPTGSFANGVASITATTAITRANPDDPDGPFTATQFGVAPNDADGVQMQSFNQDVDSVGGNDHFAVGPTTTLRFGRLRLANGYGADSTALRLPLEVQYWTGGGFALNSLDSCTSLARSDIALSFAGVIAACDTAVQEANVAFASGAGTLTLAAPGAGRTGTVTLTPQLGTFAGTYCPAKGAGTAAATASPADYLLGRWDDAANPDANANTAYDDKPSGRAAFGLYGSQPGNFIYFRENY